MRSLNIYHDKPAITRFGTESEDGVFFISFLSHIHILFIYFVSRTGPHLVTISILMAMHGEQNCTTPNHGINQCLDVSARLVPSNLVCSDFLRVKVQSLGIRYAEPSARPSKQYISPQNDSASLGLDLPSSRTIYSAIGGIQTTRATICPKLHWKLLKISTAP